jgi:triosephosphate isomerase
MVQLLNGKPGFQVAAQNCYAQKSGAFTGETSVEMLVSIGVTHVVLGHSERREYFLESNQLLAQKVSIALEYGLTPIFCCGEPLAIREANTQNEWVAKQLQESLYHLSAEQMKKVVIAYEPIWAIGTGDTCAATEANRVIGIIRKQLRNPDVSILYGGSVKPDNIDEIMTQPEIDGALVGGASLDPKGFARIVNYQ